MSTPLRVSILNLDVSLSTHITVLSFPFTKDRETDQTFSVSLTIYSHVKKVAKGKTKEDKITTMKELVFSICKSTPNCLSFLWNVLLQHGLRDSNLSEENNYLFKYLLMKYIPNFFVVVMSY